ncbi:hypothetical protein [Geobacter sp.]|uniref:hypothetical protein n=1 Tax=Geobacter sp. TaxID=46610 RepID=UPI002615D4F2|nr:hypothetical protein [Geobacter sp.]
MANRYAAILADIKTILAAVPGVGTVHDYERQSADWSNFIGLFKDPGTGKILGWEITRRAAAEHQAGVYLRHHQFVLKGYMGLQDAAGSSKVFQALCEEVCAMFRNAPAGAGWEYRNGDEPDRAPAQIEIINDRMFGGVLCHCAEIALSVTERIVV